MYRTKNMTLEGFSGSGGAGIRVEGLTGLYFCDSGGTE